MKITKEDEKSAGRIVERAAPLFLNRFNKLTEDAKEIAVYGILRHARYCRKLDVEIDASVLMEVINDAQKGYNYALENELEMKAAA